MLAKGYICSAAPRSVPSAASIISAPLLTELLYVFRRLHEGRICIYLVYCAVDWQRGGAVRQFQSVVVYWLALPMPALNFLCVLSRMAAVEARTRQ